LQLARQVSNLARGPAEPGWQQVARYTPRLTVRTGRRKLAEISEVTIITLTLVLAAEFVNGWTDAPNAIATVVSTRVLRPHAAIVMATGLNILGAFSGTCGRSYPREGDCQLRGR